MPLEPAALRYLAESKLGRLATFDPTGMPHVVPLGWRYDLATGVLEVTGRDLANTRKFHNVRSNPNVALVVDDVLPRGDHAPSCFAAR